MKNPALRQDLAVFSKPGLHPSAQRPHDVAATRCRTAIAGGLDKSPCRARRYNCRRAYRCSATGGRTCGIQPRATTFNP